MYTHVLAQIPPAHTCLGLFCCAHPSVVATSNQQPSTINHQPNHCGLYPNLSQYISLSFFHFGTVLIVVYGFGSRFWRKSSDKALPSTQPSVLASGSNIQTYPLRRIRIFSNDCRPWYHSTELLVFLLLTLLFFTSSAAIRIPRFATPTPILMFFIFHEPCCMYTYIMHITQIFIIPLLKGPVIIRVCIFTLHRRLYFFAINFPPSLMQGRRKLLEDTSLPVPTGVKFASCWGRLWTGSIR